MPEPNPCSCLFNYLFKIIFTFLMIIGIIALLVLWLVLRSNKIKFYVTDDMFTQFDLSNTNKTFYYDFSLNMTTNRHVEICYDSIKTRGNMYGGDRFSSHKNTSNLHPVFKGQSFVLLGDKEKSNYNNDKSSWIYEMEVKLHYIRKRLKSGWIKTEYFLYIRN
ncbi:hypothetical protein AABB24_017771 [Solanum stoloniferum]|uniref:Late embryogenesis abundant protein LEA-2 subgroup domain-containing protein n=1 Tax=Solanum stoloniferum TaxID=62892 RepID=A0ABD2TLP7_9SOLN